MQAVPLLATGGQSDSTVRLTFSCECFFLPAAFVSLLSLSLSADGVRGFAALPIPSKSYLTKPRLGQPCLQWLHYNFILLTSFFTYCPLICLPLLHAHVSCSLLAFLTSLSHSVLRSHPLLLYLHVTLCQFQTVYLGTESHFPTSIFI